MKKYLKYFVACMLITSTLTVNAANFSDVPVTSWYYKDLMMLTQKNVVDGFNDGTFKGSLKLNMDQFIKLVVTAKYPGNYPKDTNYWAKPYINKAESENLIYRKRTDRGYKDTITREEMAYIAAKVLEKSGEKFEDLDKVYLNIKDFEDINYAYRDAVSKVYATGVITGFKDGNFKPNSTLTRSEAVAVISRLIDTSKRVKPGTLRDVSEDEKNRLLSYEIHHEDQFDVTSEEAMIKDKEFRTKAEALVENLIYSSYVIGDEQSKEKFIKDYESILADDIVSIDNVFSLNEKNISTSEYVKYIADKLEEKEAYLDTIFRTSEELAYIPIKGKIAIRGIATYKIKSLDTNEVSHKDIELLFNYDSGINNIKLVEVTDLAADKFDMRNTEDEFYVSKLEKRCNKDIMKAAERYLEDVEFAFSNKRKIENVDYVIQMEKMYYKYWGENKVSIKGYGFDTESTQASYVEKRLKEIEDINGYYTSEVIVNDMKLEDNNIKVYGNITYTRSDRSITLEDKVTKNMDFIIEFKPNYLLDTLSICNVKYF